MKGESDKARRSRDTRPIPYSAYSPAPADFDRPGMVVDMNHLPPTDEQNDERASR